MDARDVASGFVGVGVGLTTRLLGLRRVAGAFVREQFVSMLDAVSAYRPNDADVVFLDIVGRASDEKDADAATVRLGRTRGRRRRIRPVENPATATSTKGFYLITRRFMEERVMTTRRVRVRGRVARGEAASGGGCGAIGRAGVRIGSESNRERAAETE